MCQKPPLIILTGPTAVGKTELSLLLAKRIHGEIISADSMQVYKDMNIGTAKLPEEEREGIPHYLLDVLNPSEEFNVVKFKEMALCAMKEIYHNGHIPIITGGTGFYIQALLYDIDFTNEDNSCIRKDLENQANLLGSEKLYEKLVQIDPASAEIIHPNNTKRIIRALEFYELNQTPISIHNEKEHNKESAYQSFYFVLNDSRELLYQNIDNRVDKMLDNGLVSEVRYLMEKGYSRDLTSMQGLGYKEIISYLEGECSLEEAVYLIKRDTRHFAKRQLTWFKRERNVYWISKPDFEYNNQKILAYMLKTMQDILNGEANDE